MSSFRRMQLISKEELDRLRQRQVSSYDPELRAASKVEDEIHEILNKRGLSAEEEINKLQTLQHQFKQLQDANARQSTPINLETLTQSEKPPVVAEKEPMDEKTRAVITLMPESAKEKGELVLDFLKKSGDRVTFDEDNKLVVNGQPIPGTNIIDLVSSISKPGKLKAKNLPQGYDDFLQSLYQLNIPSTIIQNQTARNTLKRIAAPARPQRGKGRPGPPGKPLKILRLYNYDFNNSV